MKEKEEQVTEKTLSFYEELKYGEAVEYFAQFDYEKAINILLPMAKGGNKKSQDLMCEIMYDVSAEETERYILKGLDAKLKEEVLKIADKGEGWACFVMHCFKYAEYTSAKEYPQVWKYLAESLKKEDRGLTYLRCGIMIEWGMVPDVNVNNALVCYERAIELGCKQAYGYIGQYYSSMDERKSIDYYLEGIKAGDSLSYSKLFIYYISRISLIEDDKTNFLSDKKEKTLDEIAYDYSRNAYYCRQAEALALDMLERNVKNAFFYYGEAMLSRFFLTFNKSFFQKAEEYYNIALKHKQYKAYGSLAILYIDEEKGIDYAKKGVEKSDSISRSILIDIERKNNKDKKEAWKLAIDRWYSVGQGGETLAELYFKEKYRPQGFTLDQMIGIIEVGLRTNTTKVYSSIKNMLSDPKCKIGDSIDFDKYQKIAAELGDQAAIFDYGKRLMDEQSELYNPVEGCRYLELAIDKGSIEASRMLLRYYAKENSNATINAIRNKVIGNNTYKTDNDFFELLYQTKVDSENVDVFKQFMEDVESNSSRDYLEINRKKAGAKLLINHFEGIWTLSSEEKRRLLDDARNVAYKTPQFFVFYRPIWKEVFPEFKVTDLSLNDQWIDLCCALFESTEEETSLTEKTKNISKQDLVIKIVDDYKELYNKYEELSSQFSNQVVLKKRNITDFRSFNSTYYFELKKELLKLFVSIIMQPELVEYSEAFFTLNNMERIGQLERLDIETPVKLLLNKLLFVKINLENIPFIINNK